MNNLTEQMEQDQTEVIKSTTNIKTLSDQVLKLRAMENIIKRKQVIRWLVFQFTKTKVCNPYQE